jgi:hypothetical protein
VWSGHASCSPRLIGGRFRELPRALASAGLWCGVGSAASPKRGSRVCCTNTWINRKNGVSKFKIKEMESRYLFIILYCLFEKRLGRGVLRKSARHSSKYGIDDTWTGTSPGTIRVKRGSGCSGSTDSAAPAGDLFSCGLESAFVSTSGASLRCAH